MPHFAGIRAKSSTLLDDSPEDCSSVPEIAKYRSILGKRKKPSRNTPSPPADTRTTTTSPLSDDTSADGTLALATTTATDTTITPQPHVVWQETKRERPRGRITGYKLKGNGVRVACKKEVKEEEEEAAEEIEVAKVDWSALSGIYLF